MPEKDTVLKYNHGEKSMKVPFVNYTDTESVLEKIDKCYSNSEKPSTKKVNKHSACVYLLFIHCSFDSNKNIHDYYRGKVCMKNICSKRIHFT